jgi:hypothetical protein
MEQPLRTALPPHVPAQSFFLALLQTLSQVIIDQINRTPINPRRPYNPAHPNKGTHNTHRAPFPPPDTHRRDF